MTSHLTPEKLAGLSEEAHDQVIVYLWEHEPVYVLATLAKLNSGKGQVAVSRLRELERALDQVPVEVVEGP